MSDVTFQNALSGISAGAFSVGLALNIYQFALYRAHYLRGKSALGFCYLFMTLDCIARILAGIAAITDPGSKAQGFAWIFSIAFNFTAFACVLYTWGIVMCATKFQPTYRIYLRAMFATYLCVNYLGLTVGYAVPENEVIFFGIVIVVTLFLIVGYIVFTRLLRKMLNVSGMDDLGKKISEVQHTVVITAIFQIMILIMLMVVLLVAGKFKNSSAAPYITYSGLFMYEMVELITVLVLLFSLRRFARNASPKSSEPVSRNSESSVFQFSGNSSQFPEWVRASANRPSSRPSSGKFAPFTVKLAEPPKLSTMNIVLAVTPDPPPSPEPFRPAEALPKSESLILEVIAQQGRRLSATIGTARSRANSYAPLSESSDEVPVRTSSKENFPRMPSSPLNRSPKKPPTPRDTEMPVLSLD